MFTEITIGNETYKLRLTTKNSIALEKALGYNPISVLMDIDSGKLPKLTDMLIMLQAMLTPFNHGMNMDKVYDLFDQYVRDGHNMLDLIPVFVEVFQDSGYLASANEEGDQEEKN